MGPDTGGCGDEDQGNGQMNNEQKWMFAAIISFILIVASFLAGRYVRGYDDGFEDGIKTAKMTPCKCSK